MEWEYSNIYLCIEVNVKIFDSLFNKQLLVFFNKPRMMTEHRAFVSVFYSRRRIKSKKKWMQFKRTTNPIFTPEYVTVFAHKNSITPKLLRRKIFDCVTIFGSRFEWERNGWHRFWLLVSSSSSSAFFLIRWKIVNWRIQKCHANIYWNNRNEMVVMGRNE